MRDHNYIRKDGTRIPVSQMLTAKIQELLADGGVNVINDEGFVDSSHWIMERLRIELLIRELSL
jgi:hypothetical protein